MLVELLEGDAGFHRGVEIGIVDLDHPVHAHHVDGDAARHRHHLTLQRAADAEGNHRHPVARADAHDLRHLGDGTGEGDRIRRAGAMPAFVVSVLPAHRFGGGATLAQQDTEFGERALMKRSVGAVHGAATLAGTAPLCQGACFGAGTRGGGRAKMRAPGRHASLGAMGGLP